MYILGLSFFYHDSAAALLKDGVPVAMAEEERFSRVKHDYGFPKGAIEFVLEKGGVKAADLDAVVFYEKPFLKFDRIWKTLLKTFPFTPHVFVQAVKSLFLSKIWIRALIVKHIDVEPEKIFFSEHHLSHAAASYLCSPYDKAAILTVDGVGEWACTTLGVGEGDDIRILKEINFPHSLGLLYSAFTAFLGFEINDGEYKVMGMAPYGEPAYADKVKKLIRFFDDGSYALDMTYFSFHTSNTRTYGEKFTELFGKPRDPKSKFFTRTSGWPSYFGEKPSPEEFERMGKEQEYYADIAASVQSVFEEAVIRLANEAHKLTGAKKLCFSGGTALNSVANYKLLQHTPFEEIFIQPAAGDSGGALGAALAFSIIGLKQPRAFEMRHAYYGTEYTEDEVRKFLEGERIPYEEIADEDTLTNRVAAYVADGKVVGWFDGRFEWGPRALGSRSIIADPRRTDMKDIVNTKIKFREPYRPFAPSVLAEHAEAYFEMPGAVKHHPARYMLYVASVKEGKRAEVPAITHVNGTARPQLVYRDESPRYYRLIRAFYDKTGTPLVLNTSFNLKGEPIVTSPRDAYSTFMRSGIDVLVLGNAVIMKAAQTAG